MKPIPLLGMATHLTKLAPEAAEQEIRLMCDAGITAIRTGFLWDTLEPEPGRFRFDRLDELVDRLNAAGLEILGTIARTPVWAGGGQSDGRFRFHPPREPEEFAQVAARLAGRYRGRVSAWEIWNEPNSNNFWYPQADAGAYMALLHAAYRAIKAAAPEVPVLHGGIACCREHRINFGFMEQLFERGLSDCCDIINLHPYSGPNVPETEFDATFDRFAEMMRRHRCAKPVWLTELGTPVHSRFVPTETEQAFHLARHWLTSMKRPEIERLYWYDFRDDGDDPANFEHHFGIIAADFRLKPAYHACREMNRQLAGAEYRGESAIPGGGRLIRFERPDDTLFLLWSDARQTRLLRGIGFDLTETTMTGLPCPLFRKQDTIDLTIGPEPVQLLLAKADADRFQQALQHSTALIGI